MTACDKDFECAYSETQNCPLINKDATCFRTFQIREVMTTYLINQSKKQNPKDIFYTSKYKCERCEEVYGFYVAKYNFCPNCGAIIEGIKNDNS